MQIDVDSVIEMSDTQLRDMGLKYGDVIALRVFVRTRLQQSADASLPSVASSSEHRRSSLLQRIRERLGEQRSKRGRMSSNKNAKRPQRRVELGWLHYDERVQDLCKFALAKVVELGMLLYQRQLDHKTSWLLQNNCSFPAGCPARDILTTLK